MNIRAKIGWAVLLCQVIAPPALAIESAYETPLTCDGIQSKVISICPEERTAYCKSQTWIVNEKKISLEKNDFQAFQWACVPDHGGYKIVFYMGKGGNCDTCEKFEVWSPRGQKSHKKPKSPQSVDKKFDAQFNDIKRGDKYFPKKKNPVKGGN